MFDNIRRAHQDMGANPFAVWAVFAGSVTILFYASYLLVGIVYPLGPSYLLALAVFAASFFLGGMAFRAPFSLGRHDMAVLSSLLAVSLAIIVVVQR